MHAPQFSQLEFALLPSEWSLLAMFTCYCSAVSVFIVAMSMQSFIASKYGKTVCCVDNVCFYV